MDIKIPTAILTGDWHLREEAPKCRTDDFWEAQWRKIDFINDLQIKYKCPVIQSGDIFHHWKPSPYLLSECIRRFPKELSVIYGNHDLPQNNIEMYGRSGVETLEQAGFLKVMDYLHWGQDTPDDIISMAKIWGEEKRRMLVWHTMVWQGKIPWPGCEDPNALELMKANPEFDIIVTGHNHKTFTKAWKGRLLVNPGSLTRISANQENHEPCVFLWYGGTNTVKKVLLPIEKGVISRSHIIQKEQNDGQIQAFLKVLGEEWEPELTFKRNIEMFFDKNKVPKSIQTVVWECMDKEEI